MKTIGEILQLSQKHLHERGVDYPRRSAEELLSHLLKIKRMDLYLQFDQPVKEEELARFREWIKRRSKKEPIEYIVGEVEFYGCSICVDQRVLIPRNETELLADLVAKRVSSGVLWDLCTGSGCLGIALKKAVPALSVTLSDLSKEALALAFENSQRNGVEVEILEGDFLNPFAGRKADFIVSNPPYVDLGEIVNDFEPKMALYGGTKFYERLAADLPQYLHPGGSLFLEIGAKQGDAVKKIFGRGEVLKDWSGLDRFFFLEKVEFV